MVNITAVKSPKWANNGCMFSINDITQGILKEHNIQANKNWNLYLPCGYNDIDAEINAIVMDGKDDKDKRIFLIHNADTMVAKEMLWKNLVDMYGLTKACTMSPRSYILYDKPDVARLKQEFDINKLYIIKKNVQRQTGLAITNSLDTMVNGFSQYYVLAQELLQNPYLIKGRKINLRVYVLVICQGRDYCVYVYNDGFMYYTKKPFVKGSKDFDHNITSGYIDRKIYTENPLTHQDFRNYLDSYRTLTKEEETVRGSGKKLSDHVFGKIYDLLRDVFRTFNGKICQHNTLQKYVTFQLFGVDIAVCDKLDATIMEINKGPDLDAKDERDKELKLNCIKDM